MSRIIAIASSLFGLAGSKPPSAVPANALVTKDGNPVITSTGNYVVVN